MCYGTIIYRPPIEVKVDLARTHKQTVEVVRKSACRLSGQGHLDALLDRNSGRVWSRPEAAEELHVIADRYGRHTSDDTTSNANANALILSPTAELCRQR